MCMIVDAMTRYDNSYSNFLVSCHSDKLVRGIEHHPTPVFFSTTKVMDEGTSQHIGFTIGSVINELRENDIHVVSYPTHNSALIRNTQSFLQNTLLHPVQRVACASHVLNGILKDLLKLEPFHSVWTNVLLSSSYYIGEFSQLCYYFQSKTEESSQGFPIIIPFSRDPLEERMVLELLS